MDLSALLEPVSSALGDLTPDAGRRVRVGAADAVKPALIAAASVNSRAPVLIVVARALRARDMVDELTAWLGRESGRLKLYPERDTLPYERAAEDPWEVSQRLEVITALGSAARPIVVACAEALAQRTLSPQAMRSAVSVVSVGDRGDPEELLRRLQATGFEIEALVEAPGQAARRGGIVDVFPPQASQPVRIEYFGPQVESIRSFDPGTQRSEMRLDGVAIGLAHEFSPDSEEARRLLQTLDFRATAEETAQRIRGGLEALAAGDMVSVPRFLTALLSPYSLLDHLPDDALVILDEAQDLSRALDEYVAETATMRIEREARGELPIGLPAAQANWSDLQQKLAGRAVIELSRFAVEETGATRPPFAAASGYGGRVRVLARDLAEATRRGESVVIASQQASRLATILGDEGVGARQVDSLIEPPEAGLVQLVKGSAPHGWRLSGDKPLLLLTDAEVFGFVKQRRAMREPGPDRSGLIADLAPGDYVVHIEHGIARFAGLVTRTIDGISREFLELQYAEGDRLFVPVDQADRVARYIGPGEHRPALTRLGSGEWSRTRDRVRRAVAEIAHDLLDLYASRQVLEGHAFAADTPWQQELEASFPYVETPDQMQAIHSVKSDMEAPRPMDRLICGDVGYGKTEVAIRAAFKAVMDGYQVAVLVPTTVLAQQHYNTFRERLASLPCRVEMLSRFLNDREARSVIAHLAEGSVDVIIGTHRLLQKDVQFKKLG
ncbi:MAG TPA: CarD family transcriptional regulator, partial [Dehalococcoidia bacterium]